jgi:hypothetical protein
MANTAKIRIVSEKELPSLIGEVQIVALLGLSRTYVYYLLRQNLFKTVKKGSRIYVRKKELLSWLVSLEGGQNGKA